MLKTKKVVHVSDFSTMPTCPVQLTCTPSLLAMYEGSSLFNFSKLLTGTEERKKFQIIQLYQKKWT